MSMPAQALLNSRRPTASPTSRISQQGAATPTLLEENLPLIQQRIDLIIRRRSLSWDEADEFRSWCMVKLLENDCHILRSFRGKSSLKTYLTIVTSRLFLDFRDHRWGRFRPSAEAKRFGKVGILLEELVVRDRFDLETALRWITAHFDPSADVEALRSLAARLPIRHRLLRPATLEAAQHHRSLEHTDELTLHRESEDQRQQILQALHLALEALPQEDRTLLQMRFDEGATMKEVAQRLETESKPLYRRVYKLLRELKRSLQAEGVQQEDVALLFGAS
ncbi:MAG: sigma-70 family RNA polymerase sigma factor [Acidobacteriota bacterium]